VTLLAISLWLGAALWLPFQTGGTAPGTPKIILDAAPRAVEYQLRRLTNDELTRVERKVDDVRYRPVYLALLTRPGLPRQYFDEALTALSTMGNTSPTAVLLEGLSRLTEKDTAAGEKLLRALLGQPADVLRRERATFAAETESPGSPLVLQAAYGAMMIADGDPKTAWDAATERENHLVELLRSVPHLGAAADLRSKLSEPIASLLQSAKDPVTRTAAVSALGSTREDAATFQLIQREILEGPEETRAAGIRALQRMPKQAWPADGTEPLAHALVASLAKLPPDRRAEPAGLDAVQLAEKLADALPDENRRAIRRELRALGVQVIRIEAVPEEMLFDVKWFAVEAGKPVQIVLYNPDAMSHNLLVIKPGTLEEVGTKANTMPVPTDPAAKPYVPDTPSVLQATRLLNFGESDRLSFTAPGTPGEYPFACTFPGHWVRMYGVMLVVENMDAWEVARSVPKDPMTNQPYTSQRK
jgi:azurin